MVRRRRRPWSPEPAAHARLLRHPLVHHERREPAGLGGRARRARRGLWTQARTACGDQGPLREEGVLPRAHGHHLGRGPQAPRGGPRGPGRPDGEGGLPRGALEGLGGGHLDQRLPGPLRRQGRQARAQAVACAVAVHGARRDPRRPDRGLQGLAPQRGAHRHQFGLPRGPPGAHAGAGARRGRELGGRLVDLGRPAVGRRPQDVRARRGDRARRPGQGVGVADPAASDPPPHRHDHGDRPDPRRVDDRLGAGGRGAGRGDGREGSPVLPRARP